MGMLFDQVCAAIGTERYAFSRHATERLRQRRIPAWQAVAATLDGKCIAERPDSQPNPSIEVELLLADSTAAKAVWAWLAPDSAALLVTVHFLDRGEPW